MQITDKQKKWIINHFKNTKNDVIIDKIGIKLSALHRFARENGLKKTKKFQSKCQLDASKKGREANKLNNWPPKGYIIPKSEEYRFKSGITPVIRLGKKKNNDRIRNSADSRRKTVLSERRRVLFGLEQKTKLKVVAAPSGKNAYRHLLKKRGYIVTKACREIFYTSTTKRNEISESRAFQKYRFQFKPVESA